MLLKLINFLLFVGLFLSSCTEKEFSPDDATASFVVAREPYDEEMYDMALLKLGEFKSRFPYSQYAVEAELFMANSLFELGRFDEAAISYEQFVKLHPKHPKVDFAMYRSGECHWAEAPEDPDRDQGLTILAVNEWRKLIARFPESEFSREAKNQINNGERRIAGNMVFTANFYCKQEIYHACAYRYLQVIESYPQFEDLIKKAYREAAMAFEQLAQTKSENPDSDKNVYFEQMSAKELRAKASQLRSQGK